MCFSIPRLCAITLIAFLVCQPQCGRANEEVTQSSAPKLEGHPKNPWALYEVLKKKSEQDRRFDLYKLQVAEEDLVNPRRMNFSGVGPEIALYHYGYLNITSAPETPGGLYTLGFPKSGSSDIPAKTALCCEMMALAAENNMEVKKAFSIRNTTFERMPPETEAMKSFMRDLDTIISSFPLRFNDWMRPAVYGALYMLGLQKEWTVGNHLLTNQMLFYEDLSNDTRLVFLVDDVRFNATISWDSYFRDLMDAMFLDESEKNSLMIVTIEGKSIRDWYAVYEDTHREVLREYKP